MGHRISKSSAAAVSVSAPSSNVSKRTANGAPASVSKINLNAKSNRISIPSGGGGVGAACAPTINLQIQEKSPSISSNKALRKSATKLSQHFSSSSGSLASTCPRQIIIKIQLAKMNDDNDEQQEQTMNDACVLDSADANSNSLEMASGNSAAQILNVTLNRNFTTAATALRTAGSSSASIASGLNNNFSQNSDAPTTQAYNALMGRINTLHLNDEQITTESAEYCEVLEEVGTASSSSTLNKRQPMKQQLLEEQQSLYVEEFEAENNNCCRRKSKSSSKQQRRCYRCTCRDAIRRLLEPSSSKSNSKSKGQRKEQQKQYQQKHSNIHGSSIVEQQARPTQQPSLQRNAAASHSTSSHNSTTQQQQQFSVWGGTGSADVIIPISSGFIHLTATVSDINHGDASTSTTTKVNSSAAVAKATPNGPIVHSQVDFVHCLVPDLERITNATFYWGKMDRYEAERLLDGKPEGTFLLRDSAQEDFLFSVSFRKYGRSLHARVEHSGHKFSFDGHDPCVFNSFTVSGLLEHYKDPACVMFFEPMLTIPLQRKSTFSLQSLCRGTIVSHTTYDGIAELELPTRLKSYLKEYHYKHKLGTKLLDSGADETFYTCT